MVTKKYVTTTQQGCLSSICVLTMTNPICLVTYKHFEEFTKSKAGGHMLRSVLQVHAERQKVADYFLMSLLQHFLPGVRIVASKLIHPCLRNMS